MDRTRVWITVEASKRSKHENLTPKLLHMYDIAFDDGPRGNVSPDP